MTARREKLIKLASFVALVLVASYQLTHASLWYDEAVEYWYSKVAFGTIPYETTTNMYQRIVSTFQPPLYNVLVHFWLMVSDSVLWFRFFGVLMALVAGLGLYAGVRRVAGDYTASAAVLVLAFNARAVYYWQECAEYCLMMAALMWAIWGFIAVLQEPTLRHVVSFTALAVLAAYTQYGAVIALIPMVLAVPVVLVRRGQKDAFRWLVVAYLVALAVAVLPLILLFFLPQVANARSFMGGTAGMDFSPRTFVVSLSATFHYLFVEDLPQLAKYGVLGLLLVLLGVAFRKDREGSFRAFVVVNVVAWCIFYVAVETGYYTIAYALNPFMERYALFLLPMWIVQVFWAGAIVYGALMGGEVCGKSTLQAVGKPLQLGLVLVLVLYCGSNWVLHLAMNWTKPEDMPGAVEVWYDQKAYQDATCVYWGGNALFSYYLRQDPAWDPSMEESVTYLPANPEGEDARAHAEYLRKFYPDEWPSRLYLLISFDGGPHIKPMVEGLVEAGYKEPQMLFSSRQTVLYCFERY